MGHEGKCVMELRDLFNGYAERLYGTTTAETAETEQDPEEDSGEGEVDIEASIKNEIRDMKVKGKKPLFQAVKIDVKCGILEQLLFSSITP
jgi:tRNA acetyltransferase TAN1